MAKAKRSDAANTTDNTKPGSGRQLKTFPLRAPIDVRGKERTEITVAEPYVHEVLRAEQEADKTDKSRTQIILLSLLSDWPRDAVERLPSRTSVAIQGWLTGLTEANLKADGLDAKPMRAPTVDDDPFGLAEFAAPDPDPLSDAELEALDGSRTFALTEPVEWQGETTDQVVAHEPALGAIVSVAKFNKMSANAQQAALIAGVIDQPTGFVARMLQRDANRIMVWSAPFVQALMSANTDA